MKRFEKASEFGVPEEFIESFVEEVGEFSAVLYIGWLFMYGVQIIDSYTGPKEDLQELLSSKFLEWHEQQVEEL